MLQPIEPTENNGAISPAHPNPSFFDVTRMLHDPFQFPKDWIQQLWEEVYFDWQVLVPSEQVQQLQKIYATARSQEYQSGTPGTYVGFPMIRFKENWQPLYLVPVQLQPGQRVDEWRLTRNEMDLDHKIINPFFSTQEFWQERNIPSTVAELQQLFQEHASRQDISLENVSFTSLELPTYSSYGSWSAVLCFKEEQKIGVPDSGMVVRSTISVMETLWEALQRDRRIAVICTKAPQSHSIMHQLKDAGYKSNWMKWTRMYQWPILSGVPKLNSGLFHLQKPKTKAPIRSRILKRLKAAYKPFIASGQEDAWIGSWLQSIHLHSDALLPLSTRMDEQQSVTQVQELIREAHQLFPGPELMNNPFQYFSPIYFQHSLPEDRQTVTQLVEQLLENGRQVRSSLEQALAEFTQYLENTVRIENQERFQALKYCETRAIQYQVKFGEQLQSGMWSTLFQSAEQKKMQQDLESAYQLVLTPLPPTVDATTILPFRQLSSTEDLLQTVSKLMKGWKQVKVQWPQWIQEEKNRLSASSTWEYPTMSQNRKALLAFDSWYQEAQQSQILSRQHKSQSLSTLNALEQCDKVLLELEKIQAQLVHWSEVHPWWAFWHSLDAAARKTLQVFLRTPASQWLSLSQAWYLKRKSFYQQPEVLPDATMWNMDSLNLVHAEFNGGVQVANHNNDIHQQALLKRLRKSGLSWPDVSTQEGVIQPIQRKAHLDAFFEAYPLVLFSAATWNRLSTEQQQRFDEVIWFAPNEGHQENGWPDGLMDLHWVKLEANMDVATLTNIREGNALMDALIQDIRKQPMSVPGISIVCTTKEQRDYLSTLVIQTLQRKSLGADALRSIQNRLQILVWKEWMPGNDSWVYFSGVADEVDTVMQLESKAGTVRQWLELVRHVRKLSLFTSFGPEALSRSHHNSSLRCLQSLMESNGTAAWKQVFYEWNHTEGKQKTAREHRQMVMEAFIQQVDTSGYQLYWNYTEPNTGFQVPLLLVQDQQQKVVLLDGVLNWGQHLQVQSEERAKRQLEQLGFTLAYLWTKDLFYEKTEWKKEWITPNSMIEIGKSEESNEDIEND